MHNEDKAKGIGKYYIVSFLFHVLLIGLLVFISIKFKSKIQSLGSKVVVSVVSTVPGPLASTRALTHSIKKNTVRAVKKPAVIHNRQHKVAAEKKIVPVPAISKTVIPVVKSKSSMIYPKKVVPRHIKPQPNKIVPYKHKPVYTPPQQVPSNVYSHLNTSIRLNSAYSKLQSSMIAGNVHRFTGYINKITSIIISNFNINLSKYLHFKSIIAFKITKDGLVYDVRLIKSSGSGFFDAQSIAAVKSSAPLPPPPHGFMSYMNSKNDNNGVLAIFYPKQILKSE
jgi:TonB family protein